MKLVLLFTLLLTTLGYACEVALAPQLVVLGPEQSTGALETKDCSDETKADLLGLLAALEGKVSSVQLAAPMAQKGHENVFIRPYMFQVRQLKTLIREQISLPAGVHVRSTAGAQGQGLLALAPGDRVEVSCSSCLFGAQQPPLITVRGFDGTSHSHMARADFRKMVRAFRLVTSVPAFSQILSRDSLKEEYVESIPHTGLVTDPDALRFYKTNKPIKAGELLKFSDLNAVNLVRAGLRTEVILENSLVKIKTEGVSRSNGTLGDLVEVFHVKKNRKYQGKVIDVNKVLVEL